MDNTRLKRLLNEYGKSHQHPTNKAIHWLMVPLIYLSITAMLWQIQLGNGVNGALLASIPVVIYYLSLSPKLGLGMALFNTLCLTVCYLAEQGIALPLWQQALIIFIPAWVFQLIGHHIEGKKPSFLKDLQFLLIGPAWLMNDLYQRFQVQGCKEKGGQKAP